MYRRHYDDVRRAVPKENLLEYTLGSGWEPLCKFLGKEVPDVPFPHRNMAAILEKAFGAAFAKSFRDWVVNLLVVVGVAGGIWGISRMYFN